jgi:predicted O-methyltransferase YrrM
MTDWDGSMDRAILEIFEAGTVTGKSGKQHRLHSSIDREECAFLYETIREDPSIRKTLEVGCAFGVSTLCICSATRDRENPFHLIIDPFENTTWDGVGVLNLQKAGIDTFDLIETESEFALPHLLKSEMGQIDLILIDGYHTFDHAMVDTFYATKLLRTGGYLVLDDVSYRSVRRVVDFLMKFPCYELHGSVRRELDKTMTENAARFLLSPIPRRIWSALLSRRNYRRVFEDHVVKMVALKKTSEDERDWRWHPDDF